MPSTAAASGTITRYSVVISPPSSTVSRQDVVAAVAHALRENTLELLVRLHAADRAGTESAGGPTDRRPPARSATRRRSDGRAGSGADQAAGERALGSLPSRRSRRLQRDLPALVLITSEVLRARTAVRVHGGRPRRLRHAGGQSHQGKPETQDVPRHVVSSSDRFRAGTRPAVSRTEITPAAGSPSRRSRRRTQ